MIRRDREGENVGDVADRALSPIRLRPGRDLNPGQKLRRLLGYPLPYRDTRTDPFTLTTRVVLVKKDCSPGQRERTCGFLERGLDPTDYTPPTRTWISTVTSFPENSSR